MLTLGIETSCDDAGIAVLEDSLLLRSNVVSSQIDIHSYFGGVVPELASRAHIKAITIVLREALERAGITLDRIDAVAVTQGPGLIGSLLVGVSAAKSLSYVLDVPLIPIHHLEGHIYANFLSEPLPRFPFLAMVVSGGHTDLILCEEPLQYQILGRTRDDAAGEAFDKIAKLMGLPYPGGPAIEETARDGDPQAIPFPRPMLDDDSLDFSFSGLKTAVLYHVRDRNESETERGSKADILASFQQAVADVLVGKAKRALEKTGLSRLVLAGGVIANQLIRNQFLREIGNEAELRVPPVALCGDNGAMIACAGYHRYRSGMRASLDLNAVANLGLA